MSWGISCGKKNEPGAYAAVTDDLCFIHWTTRCNLGFVYDKYFEFPEVCTDWIKKEISILQTSSDPNALTYLDKAKDMEQSCLS